MIHLHIFNDRDVMKKEFKSAEGVKYINDYRIEHDNVDHKYLYIEDHIELKGCRIDILTMYGLIPVDILRNVIYPAMITSPYNKKRRYIS